MKAIRQISGLETLLFVTLASGVLPNRLAQINNMISSGTIDNDGDIPPGRGWLTVRRGTF